MVKASAEGRLKEIPVTCTAANFVPLDRLRPLQGELKSLSKDSYQKLRESMLTHGISFPFLAWRDPAGDLRIIDGTQRDRALRSMRTEGFTIPLLPVCFVEAADEREAKIKILLANSRYGKMDQESLYGFIQENGIDFGDLKDVLELAEFKVETFEPGWLTEPEHEEQSEDKACVCPTCGNAHAPKVNQ